MGRGRVCGHPRPSPAPGGQACAGAAPAPRPARVLSWGSAGGRGRSRSAHRVLTVRPLRYVGQSPPLLTQSSQRVLSFSLAEKFRAVPIPGLAGWTVSSLWAGPGLGSEADTPHRLVLVSARRARWRGWRSPWRAARAAGTHTASRCCPGGASGGTGGGGRRAREAARGLRVGPAWGQTSPVRPPPPTAGGEGSTAQEIFVQVTQSHSRWRVCVPGGAGVCQGLSRFHARCALIRTCLSVKRLLLHI